VFEGAFMLPRRNVEHVLRGHERARRLAPRERLTVGDAWVRGDATPKFKARYAGMIDHGS